jgi:hypothetical protein
MLIVQNALGIYLNLYVVLPTPNGNPGVFPALFSSGWATAHVIVGILLFLGALGMSVIGWRTGNPRIRALTLTSLAAVVVAAYTGYHFVLEGNSAYSFLMEIGFLVAILSTVGTLEYLSRLDRAEDGKFPQDEPRASAAGQ